MPETSIQADQATRLRELALRAYRSGERRRAYAVAITSGKGGVGKSTVALNCAIALAQFGKRVLLLDADGNLGSLDVMLGISPKHRLGDVLRGERDMEEILVEPVPGLRLIPGSSGDPAYPELDGRTPQRVMDLMNAMEPASDFILIDTGAGIARDVLAYAWSADETIVVTNNEPTSVMDAYAMIKTVLNPRPDHRIGVLMNDIVRPDEAEAAAQKLRIAVRHFLGRDIGSWGIVPHDARVAAAVASQEPLMRRSPTSAAALSLRSLAQRLVQQTVINDVRPRP